MKIVVVGGGSTYTPELIDGLIEMRGDLAVREVVLVDPDDSRLRAVQMMVQRMLRANGEPFELTVTADLEQALPGADAVLIQLRVGTQEARRVDETLPLKYKRIGQETTGAGGLAKALRTVPVVLDIAETVSRVAPDAWIINFTNPVGIVTRALLDRGHKAIGLCNVAIGLQQFFGDLLSVDRHRIELSHVGLNHLSWETAVRLDGENVLPQLIDDHLARIADRVRLPAELISELGVVPSYYLRFYYCHEQTVEEQVQGGTRAEEVVKIESELLQRFRDENQVTKPDALSRRGGALYSVAAVQLMGALLGTQPGRHVVNVRNNATLPFLPDDAVIEVLADVHGSQVRPVASGSAPVAVRGLIADVSAYEDLALTAAIDGGIERVRAALLAHPLVREWRVVEPLAQDLVTQNARYLKWTQ